ncbi:MAG TPA: LLM class flavin-dependent oxidoreductase [Candidatus Dormibacteraeota bacterium]|nr:LLM class flavin-dependent oxidoreductase [Candidatus Dormibacteraeota bacterium]
MADYRRPIRFGYFLTPYADPSRPLQLAALADELGLDYVGVQDHPYQPRFHDTWTLLTAIAMRTQRISVFPDVVSLPLRPPAMLAKAAASLDLISGGRFELGLGAGAFWDPIAAMGGPRRTPGESVRALEEAIQVIRLMWSGERSIRFRGEFYQLAGAHPGPVPAHPIGIWLGVIRPRALALTGRLADGWVPSFGYVPPSGLPEMHARIDAAARSAGRDPAAIQRVYNVSGVIGGGDPASPLSGTPERWAESLATFALEHGMDTFVFAEGNDAENQLRRFALEVVPRTRELVEQARRASAAR